MSMIPPRKPQILGAHFLPFVIPSTQTLKMNEYILDVNESVELQDPILRPSAGGVLSSSINVRVKDNHPKQAYASFLKLHENPDVDRSKTDDYSSFPIAKNPRGFDTSDPFVAIHFHERLFLGTYMDQKRPTYVAGQGIVLSPTIIDSKISSIRISKAPSVSAESEYVLTQPHPRLPNAKICTPPPDSGIDMKITDTEVIFSEKRLLDSQPIPLISDIRTDIDSSPLIIKKDGNKVILSQRKVVTDGTPISPSKDVIIYIDFRKMKRLRGWVRELCGTEQPSDPILTQKGLMLERCRVVKPPYFKRPIKSLNFYAKVIPQPPSFLIGIKGISFLFSFVRGSDVSVLVSRFGRSSSALPPDGGWSSSSDSSLSPTPLTHDVEICNIRYINEVEIEFMLENDSINAFIGKKGEGGPSITLKLDEPFTGPIQPVIDGCGCVSVYALHIQEIE